MTLYRDRKHESTTAMADSFLEAAMENVYDDCLGVKGKSWAVKVILYSLISTSAKLGETTATDNAQSDVAWEALSRYWSKD